MGIERRMAQVDAGGLHRHPESGECTWLKSGQTGGVPQEPPPPVGNLSCGGVNRFGTVLHAGVTDSSES